jgi:hypothetical protein
MSVEARMKVGRWYRKEGSDTYTRFLVDFGWDKWGRPTAIYHRRWSLTKGRFKVVERVTSLAEFKAFMEGAEMMDDGWKPEWLIGTPDGPSITGENKKKV